MDKWKIALAEWNASLLIAARIHREAVKKADQELQRAWERHRASQESR